MVMQHYILSAYHITALFSVIALTVSAHHISGWGRSPLCLCIHDVTLCIMTPRDWHLWHNIHLCEQWIDVHSPEKHTKIIGNHSTCRLSLLNNCVVGFNVIFMYFYTGNKFIPYWAHCLTHWGRDKMAAIFQMTFSNTFSWVKMY